MLATSIVVSIQQQSDVRLSVCLTRLLFRPLSHWKLISKLIRNLCKLVPFARKFLV